MQVNDLFRKDNTIYRVLDMGATDMLIIGCNERIMPRRVAPSFLLGAEQITEDELQKTANLHFAEYDSLTQPQKQTIHRKYGSIGFILPYLSDDRERNRAIALCAEQFGLSKATVRNRLCAYLAFKDIRIFLSENTTKKRPLTDDEKNFRWALNKYYYTALKLPLKECYRKMLKDRYCEQTGQLLPDVPSFRQFNYYFYKTVRQENLIISREGKGEFMRNHRVMLGSGIRDFCPSIGYGMLDSTVCDIFLVDDKGELVGRPTLTACVDGYSSLCMGYSLGYEKGLRSLVALTRNIIADKQAHCKRFGIEIDPSEWNCRSLPHKLITDKGREYTSETFSQLAELGIEIVNLPPYRPELKGAVEKFFDVIQNSYKKELANKGVIFEDYQERGGVDYRKKAALTLKEFETVVLLCIVKYNSKRIINLPYDKVGVAEPFANALWNHCLPLWKENLIEVDDETLRFTLLPRGTGHFKRDGLHVNRLRYRNYAYTERYLKGGECTVAYDPENVSKVWLYENGSYTSFELIEKFFADKSLDEVEDMKAQKKQAEQNAEEIALQGKLDLARDIEKVMNTLPPRETAHLKKNAKSRIQQTVIRMDDLKTQLNQYLAGEELIRALTVLPPVRENLRDVPERLAALLDVYKIFLPGKSVQDIYNRLYLAILNSLEKKNTLTATLLQNDNFRAIKGLKRYGVIGGLEAFKVTGVAGVGKTSSVRRCAEIISDKILVGHDPYLEVIPVLFVECVADGSFKSLLYSILQEVDRLLGTTYFVSNRHVTATVDALLAAVSNVLINHVAVLVIDEIERVANDSRKGVTLINYLTQLVNQSNIAICFVGNESANSYFMTKEYMSRRTLGVSLRKMEYDEYYYRFVQTLFCYQYTLHKTAFSAEFARVLYRLSNGSPSMIVSLFAETQRSVILSGQEELSPLAFEKTFREIFSNMAPYVETEKFKVAVKKDKPERAGQAPIPPDEQYLLYGIWEKSGKDLQTFIDLLKDRVAVEFLAL